MTDQADVDLVSLIPGWLREAESFEEQARVFDRKAAALRQMVESVQVLNGDAGRLLALAVSEQTGVSAAFGPIHEAPRTNRFDPKDGPRGRDAVRLIVAERPGVWKLSEIRRASAVKGWPSTPDALNTAVQRLAADGEAIWVRKGTYSFPSRLEASAPVAGDVS